MGISLPQALAFSKTSLLPTLYTQSMYFTMQKAPSFSHVTLKIYTRLYNPKIPWWHKATHAIRGWKSCQHSGKNILLKLKTVQKQLSHSFTVKVVRACYPLLCLWMVPGTHTTLRLPVTPVHLQTRTALEPLGWLSSPRCVLSSTHMGEWLLTVLGTRSPWLRTAVQVDFQWAMPTHQLSSGTQDDTQQYCQLKIWLQFSRETTFSWPPEN